MKIYSKKGDRGQTKLGDGTPVHKSDQRVDAYGTVDELSSFLGLAVANLPAGVVAQEITWIQNKLFVLGAYLAYPAQELPPGLQPIGEEDLHRLEEAIDALTAQLPPLKNFIVPGGALGAAYLHSARSICRRAERVASAVGFLDSPPRLFILPFLNRLSDYLFSAARFINYQAGQEDLLVKS